MPVLQGKDEQQKKHEYLYWELNAVGGKQAIRKNNWKVVMLNVSNEKPVEIELYNLDSDPGETSNLKDKYPEVFEKMKATHLMWRNEMMTL